MVSGSRRQSYYHRQSQAELVEKYRMLGESEPFLDTMQQVSKAARVNRPVLIIGERGTGKELVAARLHYLSPRWQKPKVSINCAAFTPSLLESEIFGHESGAFTGANKTKQGRFEMADEGTLFLDELAQSPMALQEKILRVLEYQEFERVGGVQTIRVDVRVIAATNQDLPTLCREGKFRDDLLDRLSFEVITLPSLRDRPDDIPLLAANFALKMAREMGKDHKPKVSARAMERLMNHSWPGNVRELKNVIERAVYKSIDDIIDEDEIVLNPFNSPYRPMQRIGNGRQAQEFTAQVAPQPEEQESSAVPEPVSDEPKDLPSALEALERKMVLEALEECQFNQKKASDRLGLGYYQFRRVLKRLDLP